MEIARSAGVRESSVIGGVWAGIEVPYMHCAVALHDTHQPTQVIPGVFISPPRLFQMCFSGFHLEQQVASIVLQSLAVLTVCSKAKHALLLLFARTS